MNETLLQHFPGPQDKIYSLLDSMRRFIARRVRSNAQSLEPSNPRDFIDCFLLQMDKVALGGGIVCFAPLCFVLHALLCTHTPRFAPAAPLCFMLHASLCSQTGVSSCAFCSCSPALCACIASPARFEICSCTPPTQPRSLLQASLCTPLLPLPPICLLPPKPALET